MSALRVGWRNLWRNGRRTAITLAASAISVAVLVWVNSLTAGILVSALNSVTQVAVGEVQIHAPGYLKDRSLYRTVGEPERVLAAARGHGVAAVARSYGVGLVSREAKSAGARFWGVDPRAEMEALELAGRTSGDSGGTFLPPAAAGRVVLGRRLALSLDARPGDELVAVVQAADGSIGNELLTVSGVLGAVNEEVDRSAAIVHRDDFRSLFATAATHEIALTSRNRLEPAALAARAREWAPGAEVKAWQELLPTFARMTDLADVQMWLIGAIFFLAAGLGVMNTMLMATYERIREFGLLRALGASPWRIVAGVAVEAWLLGLAASLIGAAAGIAGGVWLQEVGIDLRRWVGAGIAAGEITFDPVMRGRLTAGCVSRAVLLMWVTCVLASLYPAVRALRASPVKAMTHA